MAKKSAGKSSGKNLPAVKGMQLESASLEIVGGSAFVPAGSVKANKDIIIISMSPMIKPAQWPKGADGNNLTLFGRFKKIFPTKPGKGDDGADKVGEGVEIVPDGQPVGVALPCTATLRQGLALTGSGENATSEYLGRNVAIELLPNKIPSKKGNAAWHFVVAIYPE